MTRCRDFASLIAPTDVATFMKRHWERAPLFVDRNEPNFHQGLFGLHDVEPAVAAAVGSPTPAVQAVRSIDGMTTHRELRIDASGRTIVASVHEAYADGHTVIVNHVNRTNVAVAGLCAEVERVLQHPVGCNLFLTPADACGFVPHYDAMDTFFLQIHGTKRWLVWPPVVQLPMGERFDKPDPETLGPPLLEVDLEPGDMLFLPRGWVHHGRTASSASLHLTLGVRVTRWAELLIEQIRRAAADDSRLREAVPFGATSPSAYDAIDRQGRQLLASVAATADPAAIGALLDERIAGRPGPLTPHFAVIDGAHELSLTTEVCRRSGLAPVVTTRDGRAVLRFAGSSVTGPSEARDAFLAVAERTTFVPASLPGLPDEARIDLVRRLIHEGLLTTVDDGPPPQLS